jgi:hypothetical protein
MRVVVLSRFFSVQPGFRHGTLFVHDRAPTPLASPPRRPRKLQKQFRRDLIDAWGCKCLVTGTEVRQILDAAHVVPVSENGGFSVSNGLLLRKDVHFLFDAFQLTVCAESLRVRIVPELRASTYGDLEGRALPRLPPAVDGQTLRANLKHHNARFGGGS